MKLEKSNSSSNNKNKNLEKASSKSAFEISNFESWRCQIIRGGDFGFVIATAI